MILHPLAVEEGHLLLDGTEDAGVAGMQAHDEVALVVVFLHQGTLLLEIHVGRRAHHGIGLMALGQCLGHQRAGIENQVGTFEHLTATNGDQVWVAGTGTDDFDKSLFPSKILLVNGQRSRPVLTFELRNDELAVVRAQNGGSLADAGRPHVLQDGGTGCGYVYLGKFFGGEEHHFFSFFF